METITVSRKLFEQMLMLIKMLPMDDVSPGSAWQLVAEANGALALSAAQPVHEPNHETS